MTNDSTIHSQITDAIAEEKKLRADLQAGRISSDAEHERIAALETQLDQLWDLLRQRQADRQYGRDPDDAKLRPAAEVEDYQG